MWSARLGGVGKSCRRPRPTAAALPPDALPATCLPAACSDVDFSIPIYSNITGSWPNRLTIK